MFQTNQIILAITALCVILVWVIKSEYPAYFAGNNLIAPIATIMILAGSVLMYRRLTKPDCVSFKNGGSPGSCELDKDCNIAKKAGRCMKYVNKDGSTTCKCKCAKGWSGLNCDTAGIPTGSPSCMGKNKQTAGTDKDGMCVCPNPNWVSGNDPNIGYVQCFKCGGSGPEMWGPFAATGDKDACTSTWGQIDLADTNCYAMGETPKCYGANFNPYIQWTGPSGQRGTVTYKSSCSGQYNSCRCLNSNGGLPADVSRPICTVNGWINKAIAQPSTCENMNTERQCSGYTCEGKF